MDATVDDFFNEINQISTKNDPKEQLEEVWQECFDELTGYSYFWNTETDQVTWVPPKSYKPADDSNKKNIPPKPDNTEKGKKLFVPPVSASAHQNTSTSVKPEAKSKVYSIQEVVKHPPEKKPKVKSTAVTSITKPISRKQYSGRKLPFKRPEDSDEDEKIELITEYGGDSDSNEDSKIIQTNLSKQEAKPIESQKKGSLVGQTSSQNTIDTSNKVLPLVHPSKEEIIQSDEEDDDNEIDLLAKIQQRAQELKRLGGKVPIEVKKIIETTDLKKKDEKSKPISAFSLVAGYNSGSSEDEYEPQGIIPKLPIFPVAPIPETGHSTLFPATKPIDVKDFIVPEASMTSETATIDSNENGAPRSDFDSKAFQRKKRIGVSLVNNVKRPKGDIDDTPKTEFAGFGFKSENSKNGDSEPEASNAYPGFQKGGLLFVKSDVLQPATEEKHNNLKEDREEIKINKKETEDDYKILQEKLLFLGEGRQPVLPVQAMLIQAETLFLAMKEGGLKLSYLFKWLKEMCSELINLEKEAAPEGWLLQWDRSQKRYFYQNQASGVSQWHYPEPDVTRCDDAMDISTTPPPPDNIKAPKLVEPIVFGPQLPVDPPLPPSPPNIRSPTPPPPPIISMSMDVSQMLPAIPDVPLPPDPQPVVPPPPLPPLKTDQPLPPGVDLLPEAYNKPKEPAVKANDTLNTALDSFYSEIAEVAENSNSRSPARISETPIENAQLNVLTNTEVVKKKKKKVKLAQGLTMKKKAVSQLVEKWRNVQKNYSD
ncbi:unnamed protein product [Ceutorhynchus assimilis]|uniref:WW domain-containing protein n=1 Tax=Ceutorhynchus assimilis TaxID=467358 RepID=A0A9N9MS90_9CUCU|nr:unnamed protein product [Ceutorhynchus assimilis]